MAIEIATHEAPVWKERADFLIFADLSSSGMAGRWEQLWAHHASDDEFVLCCIPYFAYGLALGDTVRTRSLAGKKYVVTDVVARTGRRALRLWLKDTTAGGRGRVLEYVQTCAPLHEWSSDNLLVIDVPEPEPTPELLALLNDLTQMKIHADWGD
jgi:hypothetical protein